MSAAAKQGVASMFAVVLLLVAVAAFPAAAVHSIGVCNGVIGNNLPSPADVVKLYRSKGITAMRIYAPETNVLRALRGTGIGLLMDVANEDLAGFASSPSVAAAWVKANVQPYPGVSFRYIAVGNEVTDSDGQKNILPAMKNIHAALVAAGLANIKVSTSLRFDVVTDTFPPSSGVFADTDFMDPIAEFLESTGAPGCLSRNLGRGQLTTAHQLPSVRALAQPTAFVQAQPIYRNSGKYSLRS